MSLAKALNKGKTAAKAKKATKADAPKIADLQVFPLDIKLIHVDPNQPRKEWEEGALEELAVSVAETGGCNSPIKVRPHPEKAGEYMLVFGEGRWRSHGLKNIPLINAIVDEDAQDDYKNFFEQVTENITRNPMKKIDEANAYDRLMNLHKPKLSQVQLSKKIGKGKTYLSRVMKLLDAPVEIQELSILNVTQNLNTLAYLTKISDIVTNAELLALIEEVKNGEVGEKALQAHLKELQSPKQADEKDSGIKEDRDPNQMRLEGVPNESGDYDSSESCTEKTDDSKAMDEAVQDFLNSNETDETPAKKLNGDFSEHDWPTISEVKDYTKEDGNIIAKLKEPSEAVMFSRAELEDMLDFLNND